jgi:SRP54-type protein, GTPase domain
MSTPGELLEALGREARARLGNGRDTATRVYRGRSVDELVPQIQRDLGAEAIIVRRREGLTGGVLGFFQRAFVEIEAMPGGPRVDVYDEHGGAPPELLAQPPTPQLAPVLAAPVQPVPAQPVPAQPASVQQAPLQQATAYAAPAAGSAPPPQYHQAAPPPQPPPAFSAPAPVTGPAQQQRPTFEYRSAAMRQSTPPPTSPLPPVQPLPPAPPFAPPASQPAAAAPAADTPPPFFTRQASAAPPAGAGSAYVTAHLAALARADRSRTPPRSIPERRDEPNAWAADFQELIPREQPEPFQAPAARAPAQRAAEAEHRVVAPGSHARARAGVARSLQRCGISEELTNELIDGASAHALALAPRSGLAQAVRATLAQRIPVAAPLPTKGTAIVVVGAGGSGKTTCAAVLLGAYRKSSSLPASCATITRGKDGAAGSERGGLSLILSPYVMKPSPATAPRALRALRRARGDGVAVIDTPSLSPSNRSGVRELARVLAELTPERVVVALPATLGATAAAQLLQALKPLGANALAITHADETDQLGVAVEAACRFGLAPEYMLDRTAAGGWRLRQISPTALAERLLP